MLHEKWGIFPDGLSYNDQPAALLRDWDTLDRRYADIWEHCKDLEKEDVWLPPTLTVDIADEPEEAEPETVGVMQRLRGST